MRLPWNNHIPLNELICDGVCLDHMSFSFPIIPLYQYADVGTRSTVSLRYRQMTHKNSIKISFIVEYYFGCFYIIISLFQPLLGIFSHESSLLAELIKALTFTCALKTQSGTFWCTFTKLHLH